MSARFFPRTDPGEPADWRSRAIVGAGPRGLRFGAAATFTAGMLLGVVATLFAR